MFQYKSHIELTTLKNEKFLMHKGSIISVATVPVTKEMKKQFGINQSTIPLVVTDQTIEIDDGKGNKVLDNQKLYVRNSYNSLKKQLV